MACNEVSVRWHVGYSHMFAVVEAEAILKWGPSRGSKVGDSSAVQNLGFLDPGKVSNRTTVVLVTTFRKMPKAFLIRNGP